MPNPREWMAGSRRRLTSQHQYEQHKTIAASGAIATGDNPHKEAEARSGVIRQAQQRVWSYRPEIAELGHAGLFYENCFSRIRLTVALEADDGTRIPAFDEDGKEVAKGATEALAAVRALRSPIGGQSQLMRAIGGCLFYAGEGHLVGQDDDRMKGGKAWEFLSPSELFRADGAASSPTTAGKVKTYHRIRVPGQSPDIITSDKASVSRIWRPDRQYSMLPWSTPLGLLNIFEELVLLTREVAGAARSRLATSGMFFLADDIDYPDREDAEADSDENDPFVADLIKQLSTAIREPTSAAGVVPFVLRMPANRVKRGEGWDAYEPDRKWDDRAADKRAECVQRFAQGVDLPVEVVMGHMSTTFANAAQISADMYRLYLEPAVLIGTDGLTTSYLQAALPGTPFVIHPDPTDLVVKPDQIGDWLQAFDRFAISFSSLRDKLGASEKDKPDDDEIALRLLLKAAGRATAATDAQDVADTGGVRPVADPTPATPDASSITAAVEVNMRRALQRAGARLRSKVQNNRGLASLIQNVDDREVAATLGPRTVASLMTEAELIGKEFDILREWVTEQADAVVACDVEAAARIEYGRRLFAPVGR